MMAGDVKRMVAIFYGVSRTELESSKGARNVSWPRQAAMTMCRHFTRCSYPQIGQAFGRDHTTVMYAERAYAQRVWSDPVHFAEFLSLLDQIEAGEITAPSEWARAERTNRFRRCLNNPFRDQEAQLRGGAAFIAALSSVPAASAPSGAAALPGPRVCLRGPGLCPEAA